MHTHTLILCATPVGGRSQSVSREIDMDKGFTDDTTDTTVTGTYSVISELIFWSFQWCLAGTNNGNFKFNNIEIMLTFALWRSSHVKVHYEKSQNMNFLALIGSCILLAQTWVDYGAFN